MKQLVCGSIKISIPLHLLRLALKEAVLSKNLVSDI